MKFLKNGTFIVLIFLGFWIYLYCFKRKKRSISFHEPIYTLITRSILDEIEKEIEKEINLNVWNEELLLRIENTLRQTFDSSYSHCIVKNIEKKITPIDFYQNCKKSIDGSIKSKVVIIGILRSVLKICN